MMDCTAEQTVLENKSVTSIVHDFDKMLEKKTQKRENTLIAFAMKAVARDQEKNILISRLQRELAKAQGMLNLLEIENDIKEKLIKEKEEEVAALVNEIQTLKNSAVKSARRASLNMELIKQETPKKMYKFSDVVISTQSNIVASPSKLKRDIVPNAKAETIEAKVDTSKPKVKLMKKKSIKRTISKETHVSSFLYNLRNRTKSKANEKI